MRRIISFVSRKGGVGKSTLAATFAFSEAARAYTEKIALVELDPQGSLEKWYDAREKRSLETRVTFSQILGGEIEELKSHLGELLENWDLLILDTPGESTADFSTRLALEISDVVILPMRASTKDEDAFEYQLMPLFEEVISRSPGRRYSFYVLPTFFHPHSKMKNIQNYFSNLMPMHICCLPVFLPGRSVFENFDRDGRTLNEYLESVKNNSRKYRQAQNAIEDVEKISTALINLLK